MSRLTGNTRTVVKHNYALITADSYVGSVIPGWENVEVRVIINPAMGAKISQHLIQLNTESKISDRTIESQLFFYVIKGSCQIKVGAESKTLETGGYVYIPIGQEFSINGGDAQVVSWQMKYTPLEGYEVPAVYFGNSKEKEKNLYLEDPQLHMQYLLPDHLSMDFAVNIFTYNTGGNLPFVETHIMEHGLLYLAGEGIYRLDNDYYHVTEGDAIWMAPYCPQWFTAMGKQDAVYIYCKDVNRHSIAR